MAGISDKALKAQYAENKFRYNGKELQHQEFSDGSGLEEYDYGARMQDPQIGRFMAIDPDAPQYLTISPFCYVMNNPIRLIDPNGMDAVGADGLTNEQWVEASRPGANKNLTQEYPQQNRENENPSSEQNSGTQQEASGSGGDYSNFWNGFLSNIFDKIGDNGEYHGKISTPKSGSFRVDYFYGLNDGHGNVLNTDVVGVLTSSGSPSAPTVTSDKFHFVYGPGNWQQAAVINLTFKIYTTYGTSGTVEIPYPLYFGMPKTIGNKTIPTWVAANYAMSAVNTGFFHMKEIWIHEPEMPYVKVQQLWIQAMDIIMRISGGTVGKQSAKGYMSPIIDAHPN